MSGTHLLKIGDHTVQASLVAFDKDGVLFNNEAFLLELNRLRIKALLRRYPDQELARRWMRQIGVFCSFDQHGEPIMEHIEPDSSAIVASVTEEVTISAVYFSELLSLSWPEAKRLAESVHTQADLELDDARAMHPHEGFPEIFQRLWAAGIPYGIVTLDDAQRAARVVNLFDNASRLAFILSPANVPRVKPAPDALVLLAERFSVLPSQIVMIGDMYVDLQMAKTAGAFSVGIPETDAARHLLEPFADVICRSLNEITVLDS